MLDELDVPDALVAVNEIEYDVFDDNPEIVYALDVPDPVPELGVYPVIVPEGAVKLIVTELDVALTNVRLVGADGGEVVVAETVLDEVDVPEAFVAVNDIV